MVDFGSLFGAIIVLLLMCFFIVFFAKEANLLAATQTELLLHSPDSVAIAQSSPESIPEARDQSATAVSPPETRSPSRNSLTEIVSQPAQGTPSRSATYELGTTSPKSSKATVGKKRNFASRRFSSRRKTALTALIEMWFRPFRSNSRH
jgi:hypothetical protein